MRRRPRAAAPRPREALLGQRMTLLALLLLATLAAAASEVGGSCANRGAVERKVRFWVQSNKVGPASPPNGTVAAAASHHCKAYLLSNLTRYQGAISSLGIYSWTIQNHTVVDSTAATTWQNHTAHTVADPDFWPCLREIRREFPHIKLGAVGSVNDDEFVWMAQHPGQFEETVRSWVASHAGLVDEMWTDFEPHHASLDPPNGTHGALEHCTPSSASLRCKTLRGINAAHAAMQAVVPTFAYAHCGNYWETIGAGKKAPPGYAAGGAWTESCAKLANGAPGVTVQASNTYRDDTVSSGKSGGFERLLLQEIADITDDGRSPHNLQRLSPALCPDCPTGNSSATGLTMAELYERELLVVATPSEHQSHAEL